MMSEHLHIERLGPRLRAMARQALPGQPVADVATDHARVAMALASSGRHPRVIATDRSPGALAGARVALGRAGLADRVDLREGDGLEPIDPGEATTVIIGGMGGHAIRALLSRDRSRLQGIRRLVLQPTAHVKAFRHWLVSDGWHLVDEEIVRDGKRHHWILVAEPACERDATRSARVAYTDLDWRFGAPVRRRCGPEYGRFLATEEIKVSRWLGQLLGSARELRHEARRRELATYLDQVRAERRRLGMRSQVDDRRVTRPCTGT